MEPVAQTNQTADFDREQLAARDAILAAGATDCAVVRRVTAEGNSELAAWVVGPVPSGDGFPAMTSVSCLPRTADGRIDIARLEQLLPPEGGNSVSGDNSASSGTTDRSGTFRPAMAEGEPLIPESLPRNTQEVLERAARGTKAIVSLRADGAESRITWTALREAAARVTQSLRQNGLVAGDKVVLLCGDCEESLIAFWGCEYGGFVPVPMAVPAGYAESSGSSERLQHVLTLLEQPALAVSDIHKEELESWAAAHGLDKVRVFGIAELLTGSPGASPHSSAPDDLALILFTSGSTGVPKGVTHTHATLVAYGASRKQTFGCTADDVKVNWAPLDHVGGIVMAHFAGAFNGDTQVHILPEQFLREPLLWIDLIDRFRGTWSWAPNFAFALVNDRIEELRSAGRFDRQWDLSCVKTILNGGEAIVGRTARRFLHLLGPFGLRPEAMTPAWGMSETCSGVTFAKGLPADDQARVDVGHAVPGFSMRIVDSSGQVVPEGIEGRLQVKGVSITPGYYLQPQLNSEAFTADGWFETGDLALLCAGSLTITGRSKDVIIANGVNYHSHEIETVVEEIPGVEATFTAACAVRRPGAETDQLCIFFHPADDSAEDVDLLLQAIRHAVVARIGLSPAFLIPVERAEIPKTGAGKIRRAVLKSQFESGNYDRRIQSLATIGIHERVWIRSEEPEPARTARATQNILILGEDARFGLSLRHALIARGFRCAGSLSDSPDAVIYLSSRDEADVFSVLRLVRSLRGSEARLIAVTTGGCATSPDDVIFPRAGMISGLLRSVSAGSTLDCRQIDLDAREEYATADNARLIAREFALSKREPIVAFRGGWRMVWSLKTARTDADAPGALKHGGLYLVTGGSGGVGSLLVRHLTEQYDAQVVVIGRRQAGPIGVRSVYEVADCGDFEQVHAVVIRAEARCGRTLDGIFHLAGDKGMADDPASADAFLAAFRAKVDGTIALARLMEARPEVQLVLFSSVLGLFGSSEMWAYSAANSFMDLAASNLRKRFGERVHCFNWSTWDGLGMSASTANGSAQAAVALGYQAIPAQEGIRLLEAGLRLKTGQVVVGLDSDNRRIAALIHDEPRLLMRAPVRLPTARQSEAQTGSPTEQRVAAMMRDLLHVDGVGLDDSLFMLGGDSLAAVRLLNRIEEEFGVRLALRSVAEMPTPRGLAQAVERKFVPAMVAASA